MVDTLDQSVSLSGLAWRTVLVIAAVCAGVPLACVAAHNATHPAPLGRSAEAMLRRVDQALPPGTTLDSAKRFLRAEGVEFGVYSPVEAARFMADSLRAGGPVLTAVQPAITRRLYVWNGYVSLYFAPDGRLVRRETRLSADNPL